MMFPSLKVGRGMSGGKCPRRRLLSCSGARQTDTHRVDYVSANIADEKPRDCPWLFRGRKGAGGISIIHSRLPRGVGRNADVRCSFGSQTSICVMAFEIRRQRLHDFIVRTRRGDVVELSKKSTTLPCWRYSKCEQGVN